MQYMALAIQGNKLGAGNQGGHLASEFELDHGVSPAVENKSWDCYLGHPVSYIYVRRHVGCSNSILRRSRNPL